MQLLRNTYFHEGIASIFSAFLFLLFSSCSDNSKATFDYSQLNYDATKIKILRWDTLNSNFPKNSDAIPLTQVDLQMIDSLLNHAVDSFNNEQNGRIKELMTTYNNTITDPKLFLLNLNHFKMEYVPYNDVNHRDIVDINCFCDGSAKAKNYEAIWGRRNYCHFQLTIDLKQRKASTISIDYNFG